MGFSGLGEGMCGKRAAVLRRIDLRVALGFGLVLSFCFSVDVESVFCAMGLLWGFGGVFFFTSA